MQALRSCVSTGCQPSSCPRRTRRAPAARSGATLARAFTTGDLTAALVPADAEQVLNALKGPTLSELLVYGQSAVSLAGAAWTALVSPFRVFGDEWALNILFIATILLTAYNLVVAAPRQ